MSREKIDENLKEILDNLNKEKKLSQEQIQGMLYDIKERFDFDSKLDSIVLKSDKFVIFVDGNDQLVYENGEFFIEDTIDRKKKRQKKKKSEARDLYIEYFIKYQLNPIIKQKEMNGKIKAITRSAVVKTKEKKEEIKTTKKEPSISRESRSKKVEKSIEEDLVK